MHNHEQFLRYREKITLNDSHINKLREKREVIREKIRTYFASKNKKKPSFHMQGSFAMKTTIIPLSGEYDLDDGIYIQDIDTNQDIDNWLKPQTIHNWIYDAIDNHTSTPPQRLKKCVRVTYQDGINFHLDLPCYVSKKINKDDKYYVADKSKNLWNESDPKAIRDWFKIELLNKGEQLRSIIIYLKGWKDYREFNNKQLKLLGGFQLTVLAVNCFVPVIDNDEKSFILTLEKINRHIQNHSKLVNPVNTNLDLFESYGETRLNTIKEEIQSLYDEARTAYNAKTNIESAELWQNIFGDRFSMPKEEVRNKNISSPPVAYREDKNIGNSSGNGWALVGIIIAIGLAIWGVVEFCKWRDKRQKIKENNEKLGR